MQMRLNVKHFFLQLEEYLLSLGWGYLMDKSTCMKEFKVCPGGGLQYRTALWIHYSV